MESGKASSPTEELGIANMSYGGAIGLAFKIRITAKMPRLPVFILVLPTAIDDMGIFVCYGVGKA